MDGFLAMETSITLEKESHKIAIICKDLVVVLAFDTRELLIQWEVKIKAHLCEGQSVHTSNRSELVVTQLFFRFDLMNK